MVAIGGKTKKAKVPTKPQFVIQRGYGLNEYALISADDQGHPTIAWIGDPNSATKYDSKFSAKSRTREFDGIPENRTFKELIFEKK